MKTNMYHLSDLELYYFVALNIITFILFFVDKKLAVHHKNRISENTLLLFCALGGALGGIISMNIFHHKTKKRKFKLLPPIFLLIHLYIMYRLQQGI